MPQLPEPCFDLVVVGGGPAGLATALAASHEGLENIAILESRSGQQRRNNVLLLDDSIVAGLRQLGVDVSGFSPATSFTFIDGDAGLEYRFPLAGTACDSGRASVLSMFPRRTPAADVLISGLEQALLDAIARRPGIRLLMGVDVTSVSPNAGGRTIAYLQSGTENHLHTPLIAICDGAHSSMLELLGVGRVGRRRQEVAMMANFCQPGRGQIKFQRSKPLEEVLALCSEQGSTITVRMPLDTDMAGHSNAEARAGLMRQHAGKLGISGAFITPPAVVEISHDRAERCLLDDDIFVLGDAARTATPRLGLGANWAIRDALRFARLLPQIRSGNYLRRKLALWKFQCRTRLATEVLLFQGWMLNRADQRSKKPMPANWRFRQKSLLMRFMWRAGKGEIQACSISR
ncbi:MAG TPA: NAD(P)/FAD-dependent oxidoreductase [Xanthomonadales bacterium]|nr:NAD(P)/FAD-dependent oxidoreductase [Xanthomonadales bacterium]